MKLDGLDQPQAIAVSVTDRPPVRWTSAWWMRRTVRQRWKLIPNSAWNRRLSVRGGELTSTELEPTKATRARENVAAAGLSHIVDIRVGDALETLAGGVGGSIHLVLLDGAWTLYLPVLELLEPHLSPGALVIAENALDESGDYLDYVRNPDNGYRTIPLPFDPERGNEMSVRTA
jgi:hypothetical protein